MHQASWWSTTRVMKWSGSGVDAQAVATVSSSLHNQFRSSATCSRTVSIRALNRKSLSQQSHCYLTNECFLRRVRAMFLWKRSPLLALSPYLHHCLFITISSSRTIIFSHINSPCKLFLVVWAHTISVLLKIRCKSFFCWAFYAYRFAKHFSAGSALLRVNW